MFQLLKNQHGIALLIVLSTLMIMTTAIVEFAYTSRINYRLAVNNKERVQAYYLAQSALNFSKLILKYNKEVEKQLKSAQSSIGSMSIEPLYRMMPLSSSVLRGVFSGDMSSLMPSGGEEGTEGEEEGGKAEKEMGGVSEGLNMIDKEEAKKFLSFDGDFSAEIFEEQTKFDLNKIYGLETSSATYDLRKKLLFSILLLPPFKDLFENQEQDAQKFVHALSDWVDMDGVINEFENVQRGNEDNQYVQQSYSVKNGKFVTLSEMRLVAGMNDKIYKALAPFVTVYNGTEKINACLAEDDLLRALIHHYLKNGGCSAPLDYENEEKFEELITDVRGACPDPEAMASALNSKLGLGDIQDDSSETPQGGQSGSTVSGCSFQFKDLLTQDNNIFTIKALGTVGETEVLITMVLDTNSSDPTKWNINYYRIN